MHDPVDDSKDWVRCPESRTPLVPASSAPGTSKRAPAIRTTVTMDGLAGVSGSIH
jgi:hypothetical protein